METISTDDVHPNTREQTPTAKSKRGKPNPKRQAAFRSKKNVTISNEIVSSVHMRLKISDPTAVNTVQIRSSIIPARIPISFRNVPTLITELWSRFSTIGTRPFQNFSTNETYKASFVRMVLTMCEAKLCHAQQRCENVPPFDLSSIGTFSEMELRLLTSATSRMPVPIAVLIESIGLFTVDSQPVVPIAITATPHCMSGAVNLTMSGLDALITMAQGNTDPDSQIWRTVFNLTQLPLFNWSIVVDPVTNIRTVAFTADTIAQWAIPRQQYLPLDITRYLQVVSAMESKKGLIVHVDIKTGQGSAVQAVRYPDLYDPNEIESLYYTNTNLSAYDEQLSGALLLGFENNANPFSRFCSGYAECLKHGTLCQTEARHALLWILNE